LFAVAACGHAYAAPFSRALGGGVQSGNRPSAIVRAIPARTPPRTAPAASSPVKKSNSGDSARTADSRLSSSSFLANRGKTGGLPSPGGSPNMSDYAKTAYVDNLAGRLESRVADVENDLADKADKADTYAKSETYSAQEIDDAIAGIKSGGGAVCAGQTDGSYVVKVANGVETCAKLDATGDVFIER
jgi:hypothetical protein